MVEIKIEKVIATYEDDKLISISLQADKTHTMTDYLCEEIGFEQKEEMLKKLSNNSNAI